MVSDVSLSIRSLSLAGSLLFALLFTPPLLADSVDPGELIEFVQPVVSIEAPEGTSLKAVLEGLKEKIEMEGEAVGEAPTSWLGRRLRATRDKFNFRHRVRVGIRETNNAPDGTIVSVPFSVVAANTATAMIGIHVAESLLIGPAMIAAGKTAGGSLGMLLKGYGGLLVWPVPTGTPVDLATETFCLIVGGIVVVPAVQRGIYRIELALGWATGSIAHKIRLNRIYHKFFYTQKGVEKLDLLSEGDTQNRKTIAGRPNSFLIEHEQLGPLAELNFEPLASGDVRLASFTLFPLAQSDIGRRTLARELMPFGWNVRDAVLKPAMLLRGGHGLAIYSEKGDGYRVNRDAVLLKRSYFKLARKSKAKCPAQIAEEIPDSALTKT